MFEFIIFIAFVLAIVFCFRAVRAFLTGADEVLLDNTIKWIESHDIDIEGNNKKYYDIISHKSLKKSK